MKAVTQISGSLVIALVFGSGGYYLGRSDATGQPQADPARQVRASAGAVRGVIPAGIDSKELRAKLDAEKSLLTRFKLALQNLEAWVGKSPIDALDWLATQPASDRRDEVIRMALNQYSETDAKGAAGWAMKNLSGAELNNTLITIAENWAEQNGREAATWFLAQTVTGERNGAVENLFFAWASNEPAAALEFIGSGSGIGDLSPTLRRAALAGWAKSEPEAAVAASLASSRANNDAGQFANTLANWATMDLEASSAWLLGKLEPGKERTAAAQELATIYAQQSPDAGLLWLEKLNSGTERDAAASALVAGWARSAPAEAAKWATTQSTSSLSPGAISEITHNYMLKDFAGFQTWRAALPEGPLKSVANQVGAGDE